MATIRNTIISIAIATTSAAWGACSVQHSASSGAVRNDIGHYWDQIAIESRNKLDSIFVHFLENIPNGDTPVATTAMQGLARNITSSQQLTTISTLAEKYLYDVDTPTHSDALYITYLDAIKQSAAYDSTLSARYDYQRRVAQSNTPGSHGSDISFTDRAGNTLSLMSLAAKHHTTILLLYQPDCDHCMHAIAEIATNSAISQAVANGTIGIVAINPEGDKEMWMSSLSAMPQSWVVGYTTDWLNDDGDELYFVRSTPTLYALNSLGIVLLKDIPAEKATEVISNLIH